MANIKISDLTAAAAASGTQEFEVNDSLTSKKVTGAQVLAYVETNITLRNNVVTTASIADKNVTLAKLPDQATATILGRNTGSTGSPEVLTGAQARTIIGADNASNLTSGTVGTARLATGTASSSTYLRGDQTWASVSGFSGPRATVYTSNSTFTIPSGITAVKVTVIGGGGGGNGSNSPTGGGAGGTAIKWLTGLTSGNTLSVTIGSGGAGGAWNGTGSSGGASTVASGTQTISTITGNGGTGGGAGGTGSGGDLNIRGGWGNAAINGGVSGASFYGNGVRSTAGTGTAGSGYGSGGGHGNGSDCTQQAGGAGGAGVVVFEY